MSPTPLRTLEADHCDGRAVDPVLDDEMTYSPSPKQMRPTKMVARTRSASAPPVSPEPDRSRRSGSSGRRRRARARRRSWFHQGRHDHPVAPQRGDPPPDKPREAPLLMRSSARRPSWPSRLLLRRLLPSLSPAREVNNEQAAQSAIAAVDVVLPARWDYFSSQTPDWRSPMIGYLQRSRLSERTAASALISRSSWMLSSRSCHAHDRRRARADETVRGAPLGADGRGVPQRHPCRRLDDPPYSAVRGRACRTT